MIDARIVGAVLVMWLGLTTARDVWNARQTYTIPDGKALRCELVDRK